MVWASLYSASPVGVPGVLVTKRTMPSRSPSERMGAATLVTSVAAPILSEGDLLGMVLFVSSTPNAATGDAEYKLAQTIAAFLGRHMES